MNLFEVLPGLPGIGPAPLVFSHTGHGTHSEGFVVRFNPGTKEAWVGNFVRGLTGYDAALLHPDKKTAIVVSGGEAYHVDPVQRRALKVFGGGITEVVQDAKTGLIIFADGIFLWAFDQEGERWKTDRLSWDGIRDLRIAGDTVSGEAYDPMSDKWLAFSVNLETGEVTGGSFRP